MRFWSVYAMNCLDRLCGADDCTRCHPENEWPQPVRLPKELREKFSNALRVGYYFCLACQHIIEPKNCGEPHQECPECGSHRICWHPPTLTTETT